MVKLATAREARLYGPALAARRWEYINAGVYVFAALLLLLASAIIVAAVAASTASSSRAAGLAVAAVALAIMALVNAHDLAAHLAGVDCRVGLARYDAQLGAVELLVPAVHAAACALAVAGLALLLSRSHGHGAKVANVLLLVVAAAVMWVVGSVLNACQVYERADGRAQLLQAGVQVPQLLGSLLFLVAAAAALNHHRQRGGGGEVVVSGTGGSEEEAAWLCLAGSALWLAAALVNVVKVFAMHQSDAPRLEKLRGGAQEWLSRDREGRVPLRWDWEREDAAARRPRAPTTQLR